MIGLSSHLRCKNYDIRSDQIQFSFRDPRSTQASGPTFRRRRTYLSTTFPSPECSFFSVVAIIGGGLGTLWRKMWRLMK